MLKEILINKIEDLEKTKVFNNSIKGKLLDPNYKTTYTMIKEYLKIINKKLEDNNVCVDFHNIKLNKIIKKNYGVYNGEYYIIYKFFFTYNNQKYFSILETNNEEEELTIIDKIIGSSGVIHLIYLDKRVRKLLTKYLYFLAPLTTLQII